MLLILSVSLLQSIVIIKLSGMNQGKKKKKRKENEKPEKVMLNRMHLIYGKNFLVACLFSEEENP